MFPKGPPSAKEILKIARRTTGIIEQRITSDVCLFGSAASYLWADIGRVPKVRGTQPFRLPYSAHSRHAGYRYRCLISPPRRGRKNRRKDQRDHRRRG